MQRFRFIRPLQSVRLAGTSLALGAMLLFVASAIAQELPDPAQEAQNQADQQQEPLNDQLDQVEEQQEQQESELNQQLDQAQEQQEQQQDPLEPRPDQPDVDVPQTDVETQADVEGRTQTEVESQADVEGRTQTDIEGQADIEGRTRTDVEGQAQTQERPTLGISIDQQADASGGITIGEVMEGSAAAEAGLRNGDVIVSIDGRELTSEEQLQTFLREQASGQPLDFMVRRNGQEQRLSVNLREMAQEQFQQDNRVGLGVAFDEDANLEEGISIAEVMQSSVAADAGIRRGDVILSFDGQQVTSAEQFDRLIQRRTFGDTVDLIVLRDGRRQTLPVTFRQMRFDDQRQFTAQGDQRMGRHGWLGITLQREDNQQGAAVATVYPAGPAARAGIRTGDRIVVLEDQRVSSVDQLLQSLSRTSPGDRVDLVVFSNGRERNVTVVLEDVSVFNVSGQQQGGSAYTGNDPEGFQTQMTSHDMLLEQHRHLAEQHQRIESMLHQIQADLDAIQRELNIRDDAHPTQEFDAEVQFDTTIPDRQFPDSNPTDDNEGPQFQEGREETQPRQERRRQSIDN